MQVKVTPGSLVEWRQEVAGDGGTAAVVTAAQSGDREALGELYARFAPKMTQVARRRLFGNGDAAQDIVSDVWVEVLASIERWQARTDDVADDFRQMLFGVLRSKCGQYLGSRWREVAVDEFHPDEQMQIVGATDGAEDVSAVREQLLAKLREGVEVLCPQQREAIRLKMQGLSSAEIADKVGGTPEQVRRRWSTAESRLRLVLADPVNEATSTQLADAANLLPEPHREVMLLRVQGIGPREISNRTGREYAYVRQLVRIGREMMRRRMLEPAESGLVDMQAARERRDRKRAQLREYAAQLPAAQREVALLRIDGLRNARIAEVLGRNDKATASMWRRAQESLTRLGAVIEMPSRGSRSRLAAVA